MWKLICLPWSHLPSLPHLVVLDSVGAGLKVVTDEFKTFFAFASEQKAAFGQVREGEENKERMTIVPCANVRRPFAGDPPASIKELYVRHDLVPIWDDALNNRSFNRTVLFGGPGIGKTMSLNIVAAKALNDQTCDIFCHVDKTFFLAIIRNNDDGTPLPEAVVKLLRIRPGDAFNDADFTDEFRSLDNPSSLYLFDTGQASKSGGEKEGSVPLNVIARTIIAASIHALHPDVIGKQGFRRLTIPDPDEDTFLQIATAMGHPAKVAVFSLACYGPVLRMLGQPSAFEDARMFASDCEYALLRMIAAPSKDEVKPPSEASVKETSGKVAGYNAIGKLAIRPWIIRHSLWEAMDEMDVTEMSGFSRVGMNILSEIPIGDRVVRVVEKSAPPKRFSSKFKAHLTKDLKRAEGFYHDRSGTMKDDDFHSSVKKAWCSMEEKADTSCSVQ